MKVSSASLGTTLALMLFALRAHADVSPSAGLELDWTAPSECPSSASVIQDALSVVRESRATKHVEARAFVEGADLHWRVTLTMRIEGTTGERSLQAPTCGEIAHATALILALSMQPSTSHLGASEKSGAGDTHTTETEPSAKREIEVPPRQERGGLTRTASGQGATLNEGPPSKHQMSTTLGAVAGTGLLPSPASGFTLALAWTPLALRAEVAGTLWFAQTASFDGNADVRGDLQAFEVAARGCVTMFAPSHFEFGPCGGGVLVSMRGGGTGTGVSTPRNASSLFTELTLGIHSSYSLSRTFAVRLLLEGVAPITRPPAVVTIDGVERTLHRPSPIGTKAMLGGELHFF